MATKTITTKYGTRIDVTGLTPEQVARVRSVAEDKGAYGGKGAALAKQLQDQNKKSAAPQRETLAQQAAALAKTQQAAPAPTTKFSEAEIQRAKELNITPQEYVQRMEEARTRKAIENPTPSQVARAKELDMTPQEYVTKLEAARDAKDAPKVDTGSTGTASAFINSAVPPTPTSPQAQPSVTLPSTLTTLPGTVGTAQIPPGPVITPPLPNAALQTGGNLPLPEMQTGGNLPLPNSQGLQTLPYAVTNPAANLGTPTATPTQLTAPAQTSVPAQDTSRYSPSVVARAKELNLTPAQYTEKLEAARLRDAIENATPSQVARAKELNVSVSDYVTKLEAARDRKEAEASGSVVTGTTNTVAPSASPKPQGGTASAFVQAATGAPPLAGAEPQPMVPQTQTAGGSNTGAGTTNTGGGATTTQQSGINPEPKATSDLVAEHPKLGINQSTGEINPSIASKVISGAADSDTSRNWNMNNPGSQVDALGNKQATWWDPKTGAVSIQQDAGGALSAANQAFISAATGLMGGAGSDPFKQAYDTTYSYLTRDYDKQKEKALAAKRQELTNRGIPISATPGSLWSESMRDIEDQFRGAYDQASNQAFSQANAVLGTRANVIGSLGGTLAQQKPTFTPYQGATATQAPTLLSLLGTISSAEMAKYGIDQDTMVRLKQIASNRGGGGAAPDDKSPIIGGAAP